VIKHAPPPEVVQGVVKKLDVDSDGYVMLEHVLDLIGEEGLGECHQARDYLQLIAFIRRRSGCGCTGSTWPREGAFSRESCKAT
jgi:hypothetical protein